MKILDRIKKKISTKNKIKQKISKKFAWDYFILHAKSCLPTTLKDPLPHKATVCSVQVNDERVR